MSWLVRMEKMRLRDAKSILDALDPVSAMAATPRA